MGKGQSGKKKEQTPSGANSDLVCLIHTFFSPVINRLFSQHFLNGMRPDRFVGYIKKYNRTHLYYLHFEVERFYPELSMEVLFNHLLGNYQSLHCGNVSLNMKRYMYKGMLSFFDQRTRGSESADTRLSVFLEPYLLLGMCNKLYPFPFLCTRREFLVFLPGISYIEPVKQRIEKEFSMLGVSTTDNGIMCGCFWTERLTFAGFRIENGEITIPAGVINQFLSAITAMTKSGKKYSSRQSFLKQVNRTILKFGHYYKYAPVRDLFRSLDKIIQYYVGMYSCESGKKKNIGKSEDGDFGLCSLTYLYDRARKTRRMPETTVCMEGDRKSQISSLIRTSKMLKKQIGFLNKLMEYQEQCNDFREFRDKYGENTLTGNIYNIKQNNEVDRDDMFGQWKNKPYGNYYRGGCLN